MNRAPFIFGLAIALLLAANPRIEAHQPDQSYLYLEVREGGVRGRVELASPLLRKHFQLPEGDFDPKLAADYVRQILGFAANGTEFDYQLGTPSEEEFDGLRYLSIPFDWTSKETPRDINLRFEPLFTLGKEHWGVCVLEQNFHNPSAVRVEAIDNIVLTFDKTTTTRTLDLEPQPVVSQFINFAKRGIVHVLLGKDHYFLSLILFVALVFPSVPAQPPTQSILAAKLLLFLLGHTLALTLAQFDLLSLPFWLGPLALAGFAILLCWSPKAWLGLPLLGFLVGPEFAQPMSHLVTGPQSSLTVLGGFHAGVWLLQWAVLAIPLALSLAVGLPQRRPIQPIATVVIVIFIAAWLIRRLTYLM